MKIQNVLFLDHLSRLEWSLSATDLPSTVQCIIILLTSVPNFRFQLFKQTEILRPNIEQILEYVS